MSAWVMPCWGRPLPVSSILTATTGFLSGLPPVNGLIRSGAAGWGVAAVVPVALPVAGAPADVVVVPAPAEECVQPVNADAATSTAPRAAAVRGLVIWGSLGDRPARSPSRTTSGRADWAGQA